MKISKLVVCLGMAGMAIASAGARYSIHISEPVTVAGTALKPGDYHMEVEGDNVTISSGKTSVQTAVKTEEGPNRYTSNAVRYSINAGKYKLNEIQLRGTRMKVMFAD